MAFDAELCGLCLAFVSRGIGTSGRTYFKKNGRIPSSPGKNRAAASSGISGGFSFTASQYADSAVYGNKIFCAGTGSPFGMV